MAGGLAASSQDKDYLHLTGVAMNLPVTTVSVNYAERNPDSVNVNLDLQTVAAAGIDSSTVVVVELGDNVPDSKELDFAGSYEKLLDAVAPRLKLVCTSTFWERPSVDIVIKHECESKGGLYTYIGNIYTDPNNPDRSDHKYSNPGVNRHPHDWGMAQISARIITQLQAVQ